MYDIKLDNNNDFNILDLSKDFELIDNDERVVQQIKIRLMTWYNEWFLDKTVGVRYDYIFNKNKKVNIFIIFFTSITTVFTFFKKRFFISIN